MTLRFPGAWRFEPPADSDFLLRSLPEAAVDDFLGLVERVATQGDRREVFEHFKGYFCRATGKAHVWSTSESWALTDLYGYAQEAAENAPLFIEAMYEACQSFAQDDPEIGVPDVARLNQILMKHGVGYELRPPRLELRGNTTGLIPVAPPHQSLAEKANELFQESLARSEELLHQGKAREAVQESLWLLETVATGFRGVDTGTGTVEGRYFNQIVKDLRAQHKAAAFERILDWLANVHGYLSSPTGGAVRHGLDLGAGVLPTPNEGRLYCNLIRSYLSYLVYEHERMTRKS